ncbi:hypothetical protein A0J61_11101 [Choanephora cucurbitarum]|uniref:Uncharacterized protein n=1 Tax=Choanephora cucurbitarum TaxID=101091 RepID=A0A1C7MVL7_9FUNG|nr:hypothetical protein A0J61_11101 [Choanephora cucurbitarum]
MRAKTRSDEMSRNNLVQRTRDWDEEEGSSANRRARQTLHSVSRDIESAEELVRKEHTFFQEALERMEGYTNQIVQSNHRTESLLKTIQQNTTVSNQIGDAIFRFLAESQNVHTTDRKMIIDNQQMLIKLNQEILELKKMSNNNEQSEERSKGKAKGKAKGKGKGKDKEK